LFLQIFQILKLHPAHQVTLYIIHLPNQTKSKTININPIGFPPDLLPPGKNLLILFEYLLIIASMSGGVGPLPEPFPPPPGGAPHGLPPLPLKIV
jgi:hypothetical protein